MPRPIRWSLDTPDGKRVAKMWADGVRTRDIAKAMGFTGTHAATTMQHVIAKLGLPKRPQGRTLPRAQKNQAKVLAALIREGPLPMILISVRTGLTPYEARMAMTMLLRRKKTKRLPNPACPPKPCYAACEMAP